MVHTLVICAPFVHCFDEDLVAAQRLEVPDGAAAGDLAQDESLDVTVGQTIGGKMGGGRKRNAQTRRLHGETFVKPKVCPTGIRDKVARPAVRDLMRDHPA